MGRENNIVLCSRNLPEWGKIVSSEDRAFLEGGIYVSELFAEYGACSLCPILGVNKKSNELVMLPPEADNRLVVIAGPDSRKALLGVFMATVFTMADDSFGKDGRRYIEINYSDWWKSCFLLQHGVRQIGGSIRQEKRINLIFIPRLEEYGWRPIEGLKTFFESFSPAIIIASATGLLDDLGDLPPQTVTMVQNPKDFTFTVSNPMTGQEFPNVRGLLPC